MISGLDHLVLTVTDVELTTAFYSGSSASGPSPWGSRALGFGGLYGALSAFTDLGLVPTVNLRRVTDTGFRARIEARWETVDFDGFSEVELAQQVEDRGRGYDALKCRAGIPLTRRVLERATANGLQRRMVLAGRAAAGSDTFDHAAAQRLGVAIRTTPGRTRPRWPS